MEYTVMSPWAEVDASGLAGLSPRLDTLDGRTIGMFGDIMDLSVYMLRAVEAEWRKVYPQAKFTYLQYHRETVRIETDPDFKAQFDRWAAGCDAVLAFYGSVPSSSLYLGYNAAYIERLGIPTVLLTSSRTLSTARRGVKAFGVPGLRTCVFDVRPDRIFNTGSAEEIASDMAPAIAELCAGLAAALTSPLTGEERHPQAPDQSCATDLFRGTARELSDLFYRNGWTNGQPIDLPTPEAVEEMVRGAGLPADFVVGRIPPRMGCATVEKIAVNAVMAGCLPTYMPVLIAAVRGALDPRVILEGWTCSQSTWGPVLTVSGKVADDINLNTDDNFLSPYYKANATIGRAFGYLMMNIGGLRPGIEDLSELGHEYRLGFCLGDSPRNDPWGPLHADYGLSPEDSAVTLFWPQEHRAHAGSSVPDFLKWLCTLDPYGWDPGAMLIFSPGAAKLFSDAGWTRQRILDYVVEYARRPASEVMLDWLKGNSHRPANVELPEVMTHSTRVFWSKDHMFGVVGGGHAGAMMTVLAGGGDHGGPSVTKIELPENWDELTAEYRDVRPHYLPY